ncbi:NUDIX hydrolase [Amycolatopsis suaedae]|uniref:NUDIX hydrolase n=1 Tax=Amycolatopsis suaedae TaxID=2510978 RepID=A0A4Q7JC85_9PSEU|nr:NUDIX hydrolase [Amycolatopsis suaedae]RZQ65490.1 NUDIX hydrolase [Amycolatopsis suaedae]
MPPTDPHGDGPERPMKDAATVVLLRDTDHGIEVFLQRRVNAMAFAAGMTVFPGGGVDGRDADTTVRWAGPAPAEWANAFDCDESLARSLVCAAVRETFEESGVLFAGSGDDVVADTAEYATARQRLIDRDLSLAAFLAESGLTLRADLLRPWANWVTPPPAPRRYDTRFFLAALPAGQLADGATTEADESGWFRPEDALADAEAGRSMLMPPTWYTLAELREFGTVADALAAQREIVKITPTLERDGERLKVVLEGR